MKLKRVTVDSFKKVVKEIIKEILIEQDAYLKTNPNWNLSSVVQQNIAQQKGTKFFDDMTNKKAYPFYTTKKAPISKTKELAKRAKKLINRQQYDINLKTTGRTPWTKGSKITLGKVKSPDWAKDTDFYGVSGKINLK